MRQHQEETNTTDGEEPSYQKSLFLRLIACTSVLCMSSIVGGIYFQDQIINANDSSLAKYLDAFGGGGSIPEGSPRRLMGSTQEAKRIYKIKTTQHVKSSSEIAWLLSFPNSGTSFTTALVRNVTKKATATNYFSNTRYGMNKPIIESEENGPFYAPVPNRPLPDSGFILTKTHCGGCKLLY